MSVSSPSFLSLMGRYLMSFPFFTTRHKVLIYSVLLDLHVAFNAFDKYFGRFKCRDIVGRYFDGRVL